MTMGRLARIGSWFEDRLKLKSIWDATCGHLVPPGDVTALTERLAELLGDRDARRRLGAAGPDRARTLCDPNTQAERLAAALQRALH